MEFDAVPVRQILTACSRIRQAYKVFCVLNERGKFGAQIFVHYTDIVIFVLGYLFRLTL